MIPKFLSLRWNQQRNFGVDGFISKISVARSLSDLLNSATEPHQMNTG